MCFSATASFSVAAITAGFGIAAVRHVGRRRELPLAIVPFLFAIQQAIEGMLWLRLQSGTGDGTATLLLSVGFLFFALVLWPSYAPFAVLAVEPDRKRRQALVVIALAGIVLSLTLLTGVLANPVAAVIRNHSIDYASEVHALSWQQVPYLICTCAPLLLSSRRAIQAFGAVVLIGYLASAYVYAATFISVWCFFAAAGSGLLYFHFKRVAALGRLVPH